MRYLLLLGFVVFINHFVYCQNLADTLKTESVNQILSDTIPDNSNEEIESFINNPNLLISGQDSVSNITGTAIARDSVPTKPPKRDIETTVIYNAKDSIFFDLENQDIFLYGESSIDYGDIKLEAERIKLNWIKKTIKANYLLDTAGRKVGKPVFTDKNDVYETDEMVYNFETRKAVITGVITEQDGAFMHGELVKKNSEDELFIRNGRYTTCDQAKPHFHIQSNTLKVIPKKKIVSGPFNLRFGEIPTFLWLPFGMFPQPKQKSSGIIIPSYGEERVRGFFLRDGGYYFDVSDYADLRLTGDIYSKGGFGFRASSNYKWRYHFNGSFSFSYNRSLGDQIENPLETNDYWIRWSHTPQTTGTSSFSASVNLGSTTYNQNNNQANQDFTRNINSQFTSNVGYRKTFQGTPWNMSMNLRHRQNVSSGKIDMTLPEMTVNMNRIYPLKWLFTSSNNPLAKISLSHAFSAKNDITNFPSTSGLSSTFVQEGGEADSLTFRDDFAEILKRGKFGGRHTIPITTSFNALKYFTVSPSVNYEEIWYYQKLEYEYDSTLEAINIDTVNAFQRLNTFSLSAGVNTTLYGMVTVNGKNIQAIRHVLQPSISFSYRPDQRDRYTTEVQTDNEGNTQNFSHYRNFLYGAPDGGESKSMSISVRNNIEMKVRNKKDTVNEFSKIKIFDNLAFSSAYNFAADSFKLGDIRWNARTSLFKNAVSVALSGAIDPYNYLLESETFNEDGSRTVDQRKLDQFAWNTGNGLGQMKNVTANISFNLKPKGAKRQEEQNTSDYGRQGDLARTDFVSDQGSPEELEYINANPNEYVDFSIPWTLNVRYQINRNKTGFADPTINQTMSFNGNVSITKKTKINFTSNYDFEENKFTTTRIGVNRDLHCWVLDFGWVPFGRYQSFNVTLRVRAPILKDLKLEKRRNFFDFFQ